MGELDHSFTHVICNWLNQHPVPVVACWWEITSPCPSKSPFIFASDFQGKSFGEWVRKAVTLRQITGLWGNIWPCSQSDRPSTLNCSVLSSLVFLVLSLPPCITRDGCTVFNYPVPGPMPHLCTACLVWHVTVQFVLLVMSQNRTPCVWCHSRLCVASSCDISEGYAQQGQGNFLLKEILAPRRCFWHKDVYGEGSNEKTPLC